MHINLAPAFDPGENNSADLFPPLFGPGKRFAITFGVRKCVDAIFRRAGSGYRSVNGKSERTDTFEPIGMKSNSR